MNSSHAKTHKFPQGQIPHVIENIYKYHHWSEFLIFKCASTATFPSSFDEKFLCSRVECLIELSDWVRETMAKLPLPMSRNVRVMKVPISSAADDAAALAPEKWRLLLLNWSVIIHVPFLCIYVNGKRKSLICWFLSTHILSQREERPLLLSDQLKESAKGREWNKADRDRWLIRSFIFAFFK
jgi:hypothetical protein